jgi:DNA-binding protein HU-beta
MNKSELIQAIATESGLTKADAGRALDALALTIESTLKSGDSIVLVGFGTFEVKNRAERSGRNPQTGEAITIAAAKIPSFKAGKNLKEAVQ